MDGVFILWPYARYHPLPAEHVKSIRQTVYQFKISNSSCNEETTGAMPVVSHFLIKPHRPNDFHFSNH
jgi:hypothetical protein